MEIIRGFANISNMNENHSWMKTISAIDKREVQTVKFKTAGNKCLRGTVALIAEIKKKKKRERDCFFSLLPLTAGDLLKFGESPCLLLVSISLECKFLVPHGEKMKIHHERKLCETYLEEKTRLVFHYGKVYFLNKY